MKKATAIGGHQAATMRTDEWLSPPEIIRACGEFDLDPCAPVIRPWDMAKKHFTVFDNGLRQEWSNRVWMNPPYGSQTSKWLNKLSHHGNGIALIFARTETDMFVKYCWEMAHSIFFFYGRLHFYTVEGKRASANAGGPSCLVSYGGGNAEAIEKAGLYGKHIILKNQ